LIRSTARRTATSPLPEEMLTAEPGASNAFARGCALEADATPPIAPSAPTPATDDVFRN
jgi:hypothetical protein